MVQSAFHLRNPHVLLSSVQTALKHRMVQFAGQLLLLHPIVPATTSSRKRRMYNYFLDPLLSVQELNMGAWSQNLNR